MKTFKIFKHPTLGYQAVKIGFSWTGFFFSAIWAFVKKLWVHGAVIVGVFIILTLIERAFDLETIDPDVGTFLRLLIILCQLGLYIFVGIKGNKWRENNLQRRGFELIDTVQTDTPDAAIGKVAGMQQEDSLGKRDRLI